MTPPHIVGRRHDAGIARGPAAVRVADSLDSAGGARAIGSEPPSSTQIVTGTVCTVLRSSRATWRTTVVVVSSGCWDVYGPGSVRRRRGSAWPFLIGGPFRMIALNTVGWSALLALPALAGGVASLALGRPPAAGALAAVGGAFAVAVASDRWCWWNSVVSVSSDLDLEELRRVADRLRAGGHSTSPSLPQVVARSWRRTQTAKTSATGGSQHVSAG